LRVFSFIFIFFGQDFWKKKVMLREQKDQNGMALAAVAFWLAKHPP
jgi:hypothetical protein